MAETMMRSYGQPRDRVFEALRAVVAGRGHRITGLDEDSGLITFETSPSTSDSSHLGLGGTEGDGAEHLGTGAGNPPHP